MAKKFNGLRVDVNSMSDLLNKIEKASGNVEKAVIKSVQRGSIPIKKDMQFFVSNGQHYVTGQTERSWTETPIEFKDGVLKYKIGFSVRKGGIAALFLEYGSPTTDPSYFIYYAVQRHVQEFLDEQQKALEEVLKELM